MASNVMVPSATPVAQASPLAFIFVSNEMIVQCIANSDDQTAAVKAMTTALENFRSFNDGKHATIVRPKGTNKYWITSAAFALTLDPSKFKVVKSTEHLPSNTALKVQVPMEQQVVTQNKVTKMRIRRPRNQFIIYRQHMSAKIHASNPGVTAGCISQIVAQTWAAEKPSVKAYYKALADEEDRLHKAAYPGYRYIAGNRNTRAASSRRPEAHDPIRVDEKLIAAGF
ncbi:high mobility group box-domain-containing protein [Dichotomopilus funicola]|uniref:High mobility group box-domain-containing protein n=1 Tax=Dichotomopilus funicola TaxID=1934379 RepID=A0AAN6UUH7_9PEZI|nr:high mobility group box-domain-containing protein [Dichotomopilus funicola]